MGRVKIGIKNHMGRVKPKISKIQHSTSRDFPIITTYFPSTLGVWNQWRTIVVPQGSRVTAPTPVRSVKKINVFLMFFLLGAPV